MTDVEPAGPSILRQTASPGEQRWACALISTLFCASLIAAPFRRAAFPAAAAFIPAFAGTTGIADALAAVLLFTLYRVDGSRVLLATAAAYLIDALLIGPYAVMFPGVIDAHGFIGNEQSAAWLWVAWHLTFPSAVIGGLLGRKRTHADGDRRHFAASAIAAGIAFAAIAVLVTSAGRDYLPWLVHRGTFQPLFTTLSIVATFLDLLVIVLLIWRHRPLSIFAIWVIVALASSALDTALNAITAVRFSAAWYVGKIETFISASIVLFSLLAAWSTLYARSTALAQRLAATLADGRELREKLNREHEIAAALQQASLPSEMPRIAGLTLHAMYRPASSDLEIGGDWYDAFLIGDGRLAITIGDVAGHGLAASIIMSKLRQSLRLAAQLISDPSLMLAIADTALRTEHPDTIATAFVGLLDLRTGELEWACAGHPPTLIRQPDGPIDELAQPGLPLGLYGALSIPTAVVTLRPGSLLVAYTDGLIEARKDLIAGLTALHGALADMQLLGDPDPAARLFERVVGSDARDDVAVIALAFSGAALPLPLALTVADGG